MRVGGPGRRFAQTAERPDSHQVYLRYLNAELRNVLPGLSIQAGRMPFSSGAENASGNPKIEAVKQQRVAGAPDRRGRMVVVLNEVYDGVLIDSSRRPWSATFVAFHPTQGGFEDAAGVTMKDATVLGGNVTFRPSTLLGGTELQVFVFHYDDDRKVAARPDNSGRAATDVDVGIATFGATFLAAPQPRGDGQWDALLWFAGQTGSWFEQSHRAASLAAEAGYQWEAIRWRPWVRGGIVWASGDDNPSDARHGTFFQILPTVRRFAQSAIYSQMNHTDLFVQALLRPAASVGIRADVHRVGLASSRHHWYSGSGATQARGTLFGFATRPSYGRTDLGTIAEASGEYRVATHWSINAYLGVVRGGGVVQPAFAGETMTFGYVENVLQF